MATRAKITIDIKVDSMYTKSYSQRSDYEKSVHGMQDRKRV